MYVECLEVLLSVGVSVVKRCKCYRYFGKIKNKQIFPRMIYNRLYTIIIYSNLDTSQDINPYT